MKIEQPKILFYDIETLPLSADIFQLGKQVIRHNALQPNRDTYDIITIQYCWEDSKKVVNLSWIGKDKDSSKVIEAFDKQVQRADILIGKNSDRFDSKHLNTYRLLHGLPPIPDWGSPHTRDDLEKQIRTHFYLPSYSLDYLCKMLFNSGKDSMSFPDWQNIRNYKEVFKLLNEGISKEDMDTVCMQYYGVKTNKVISLGKTALKKMKHYGDKDTLDTIKAWKKVKPYIKPKLNVGRFIGNQDGNKLRCKHCGSDKLTLNGVDNRTNVPKQKVFCKDCKRQAGLVGIKKNGDLTGEVR